MFYGAEKAAGVIPVSEQSGIRSLMDMYELLGKCWCAETCAPRMRDKWAENDPTWGQCSVTAFLVQDIFGGKVRGLSTENGSIHCYNVIEGQVFDLTDAQFGETELHYQESDPEQLREKHFQDAEKQQRYQLLRNRLNYVLEARKTDEKYQEDFRKYRMSFREEDRRKAMRVLESEDLCSNAEKRQILEELIEKYPDQNDIKASWAMLLFQEGDRGRAIEILMELFSRMPHDLVLRTTLVGFQDIMGHEEEIADLYQGIADQTELKQFDYHHYAQALLMTGKLKDGGHILKQGMNQFAQTFFTESPQETNDMFRLAIMEDIRTSQNEIKADLLLYKKFLSYYRRQKGLEDVLSDTIVEMSTHLDAKWLRSLFLDFVIFVDQLGILKEEPYCNTISTAYTSLESWEYHEDPRISNLMENILSLAQYEAPVEEPSAKEKMFPGKDLEHYRYRLTYQCYLCLVWDQFQDEIAMLPETYPKTWERVRDTIVTIQNADKEEQFHIWLEELKGLLPLEEHLNLESQMRIYAWKAAAVRKEQEKVSDGNETYRRSSPKIGPNDPCPCGSGKKYKKCCGRVR